MRFSLLQLMLLSAALALGLGLHLSSQRAQDYWLDEWFFEPQSVDFSPDGKLLAISFPGGEVAVVEIMASGFQRRPCFARWAGRLGMGHPRWVANDRFVYYQENPADVRSPLVASWDVFKNRATADSPFAVERSRRDLDQVYRERSGVGVFLPPTHDQAIIMPGSAAEHRHIRLPGVNLTSWDLGANGDRLVVLGYRGPLRTRARLHGYVIDIGTGEVLREFRADSALLSRIAIAGADDSVFVLQSRNVGHLMLNARSTEDWSLQESVEFRIPDHRKRPGPHWFSGNGQKVVIEFVPGEAVVLDIPEKRHVTTITVAPPLWRQNARALGYLLGSAQRSQPQRVALSPDGKAFAIVQDMHVDLWEVDSDHYLGRAWTAWNPWGPIRRHIGLLAGFGVVTGLIWRWERKQGAPHPNLPSGWRRWSVMTRFLLLGLGGALIVRLVPPLFLPEKVVSDMPSLLLVYGVLFTGVLAVAFAIGWPQPAPVFRPSSHHSPA